MATDPTEDHFQRRRANGQGTVYKYKGRGYRWQFRNADGEVLASGICPDKRQAERALSAAITDHTRGVLARPERITVAAYARQWLELQRGLAANTQRLYRVELGYGLEVIGHMLLRDVRPSHIKAGLLKLAERPMGTAQRPSGHTMSTRTLGMVRGRLRAMFQEAVRDQLIYANPVIDVRRIRGREGRDARTGLALEYEQALRLCQLGAVLYEAGLCRLWVAVFLALSLGLRRGEVMGLRWNDIDFAKGLLHVRDSLIEVNGQPQLGKPKTQGSQRSIPLKPSVYRALQKHQARQHAEQQSAGEAWVASQAVFATEFGSFTHPTNLARTIQSLCEWSDPERLRPEKWRGVPGHLRAELEAVVRSGAALPRLRPHDLRHTAATLMLRSGGMSIEQVSRILGHASIIVTVNIYRHVSENEIRERMIDLFPGSKPGHPDEPPPL